MGLVDDLQECAISSWYDRFKHLTFTTILVPLPPEFVEWIVSDGLLLPENSAAFPNRSQPEEYPTEDDYREWSSEDGATSNDEGAPGRTAADFPDTLAAISAAIEELGGAAAPKFTWSCPKDAVWMTGNSLRCGNAEEVAVLLKASDRVAHDVCSALQDAAAEDTTQPHEPGQHDEGLSTPVPTIAHVLALRKWHELHPGREFRCFVVNNILVGVCQRDLAQRFDHVAAEAHALQQRIEAFHQQSIAGKFTLRRFAFDCYVPAAPGAAVRLLDFNPCGATTSPLLFSWDELLGNGDGADGRVDKSGADSSDGASSTVVSGQGGLDFRILEDDVPLRPAAAAYGVPFDFIDASEGSALSKLLSQRGPGGDVWSALQQQQQQVGEIE